MILERFQKINGGDLAPKTFIHCLLFITYRIKVTNSS